MRRFRFRVFNAVGLANKATLCCLPSLCQHTSASIVPPVGAQMVGHREGESVLLLRGIEVRRAPNCHMLPTFFGTEREPVRPCNFHTVVIGGFVAHSGPFQLKWWLWFLHRPKMVLLVIVTPKYVGFGYYLGEMPHKFINQKPKKLIPWRKPLGTTFLPRLWF